MWESILLLLLLSCPGGQQGSGTTDGEPALCAGFTPDVPGFAICGAQDGDRAEGKPGGDVNGDGLTDIIVETDDGPAYIVFGKANSAEVRLAELAAGDGFVIDASASMSDLMVMPATDVNGDGFDDLYVMSGGYSPEVYVVFGGPDILSVDLSALAPVDGRQLFAVEYAEVSWIEPLGDVNGDGFADLAVIEGFCCALDIDVIFGAADPQGVTEIDVEADIGGFVITGASWTEVDGADVNGDGFSDIVVEKIGNGLEGDIYDGPLHVIFGGPELHGLYLGEYGDPPVSGGFTIFGPDGHSGFETAVGDINGDGIDDLILTIDLTYSSETVVVLGKADTTPVVVPADLANGAGFAITLDAPDRAIGPRLTPDLNGDGFADITLVAGNKDLYTRPDDRAHVIYGKADAEPVAADAPGAGFSLHATPPGEASGKFGGWSQINGQSGLDLIVSTHEGSDEPPEPSRIFVYFDNPHG